MTKFFRTVLIGVGIVIVVFVVGKLLTSSKFRKKSFLDKVRMFEIWAYLSEFKKLTITAARFGIKGATSVVILLCKHGIVTLLFFLQLSIGFFCNCFCRHLGSRFFFNKRVELKPLLDLKFVCVGPGHNTDTFTPECLSSSFNDSEK